MSVRVLIVDDSQAAREIIAHFLRAAGCVIAAGAANTADALRLFRKLKPEVVTLDLIMPRVFNIDSMGLLRTMKRESPEIAVIVISAVPFEKTREDFLRHGVLSYIVKPLTDQSFEPARLKLRQLHPELALADPYR
jgi:two-component system chemotaxis response regulator CheY